MISSETWWNAVFQAVEENTGVELTTSKWEVEQLGAYDFLEVEFDDTVNTLRILSQVDDDVKERTTLSIRQERGTIQFNFEEKERAETLRAIPLLRKILEEDVPVREQFEIDYSIHEGFVIVKSPVKSPIRLFETVHTPLWILTGIYYMDGVYYQRFEQFEERQWNKNKSPVENYGKYRLHELLWDITTPCSNCSGDVTLRPLKETNEWAWKCESCGTNFKILSLDEVIDNVDPLDTRKSIIETFTSLGNDAVYS